MMHFVVCYNKIIGLNYSIDPICNRSMARMIVVLLLGLSLWGRSESVAFAQDPKAEASQLYDQGNQLFSRGEFQKALEKYREARALFASVQIDINIAAALFEMGAIAEAAQEYEGVLVRENAPPALLGHARSRLSELLSRIASVRIDCPVAGAQVLLNGKPMGQTPLPHRLFIEPGTFRLELKKDGFQAFSETQTAIMGEHLRLHIELLPLGALPGIPDKGPVSGKAGASEPGGVTEPGSAPVGAGPLPSSGSSRSERADGPGARRTWGYALLGVGLGCVAVGTVLLSHGIWKGEQAHEAYSEAAGSIPAPSLDETQGYYDDMDGASQEVAAGGIIGGLGLAALGASLVMVLSAKQGEPDAPRSKGATGWLLAPVHGGAALGLVGRF